MTMRVGDHVEQQARSTSRAGRTGVVREVLRADPAPRYRIHWDDGRESVFTPAAGSLARLPPKTKARKTVARDSGRAGQAEARARTGSRRS
jgi:hypothetical protein